MKHCTKCGKEISQDGKFCVSCDKGNNEINKVKNNSTSNTGKVLVVLFMLFLILTIVFSSYQEAKQKALLKNTASPVTKNEEKKTGYVAEKYKDEIEKNNAIIEEVAKKEKEEIVKTNDPILENKSYDLVSIIKEWRSNIVYVECAFGYSNIDKIYKVQAGSGFLVSIDDQIRVITNKHVIQDRERYSPSFCNIKIPDINKILEIDWDSGDFKGSSIGVDAGIIIIKNPDENIKKIALSKNNSECQKLASIGDSLIVLGYPSIGSESDITATDGIISGYDGNYYITSAKIEAGNSGGVAILLKDNCNLGIPTFTKIGEVESMARILNIDVVVK